MHLVIMQAVKAAKAASSSDDSESSEVGHTSVEPLNVLLYALEFGKCFLSFVAWLCTEHAWCCSCSMAAVKSMHPPATLEDAFSSESAASALSCSPAVMTQTVRRRRPRSQQQQME